MQQACVRAACQTEGCVGARASERAVLRAVLMWRCGCDACLREDDPGSQRGAVGARVWERFIAARRAAAGKCLGSPRPAAWPSTPPKQMGRWLVAQYSAFPAECDD